MTELKIDRAKREPDWRFVPELLRFVGPEEHGVIEAIRTELSDPEYRGRMHGERKVYRRGCRGPLCSKAARDYMRRYMRTAKKYDREYRTSKVAQFDDLLIIYYKAYLVNIARRALAQARPPGTPVERSFVDAAAG